MGRAFGFGGGGGRHAAALASKKQAAAAAAAGPAPAVSDYYRLLIQQADRAAQIVADCKARRCLFVDKVRPTGSSLRLATFQSHPAAIACLP